MGETKKKLVLFDTNFLFVPIQFGIDVFEEIFKLCDFPFEIVVLDRVVSELENIKLDKSKKGKERSEAKFGLTLLERKEIRVIETKWPKMTVDDAIVRYAKEFDCWVATQDFGVKVKLKKKGLKCITVRQKGYLVVEG